MSYIDFDIYGQNNISGVNYTNKNLIEKNGLSLFKKPGVKIPQTYA